MSPSLSAAPNAGAQDKAGPSPGRQQPLWEHPVMRAVAGRTLRPGGLTLTRRALSVMGLPRGSLVMDMGCGPGATTAFLRRQGMMAVGLDLSETLLREARQAEWDAALVRADMAVASEGGDANAPGFGLPLRSRCLDGVFCECVLSTLPQPDAVLRELARVLKPGGLLVWSDLYLRAEHGRGMPGAAGGASYQTGASSQPGASCLSGALPQGEMLALLERGGFSVRVFEDHSRLLAELAGRLLFAGAGVAELTGCGGALRHGYALLVARSGVSANAFSF